MADVSVTVIGAGVVGLAVAAELAREFRPLFVLERRDKYGQETSSRNSEVIHAGLYYPHGSLKSTLCVEGNILLYEICARHGVPHRRISKIITATEPSRLPMLTALYEHGLGNNVQLEMMTADQIHDLEPHVTSYGGIHSPSTGIISAHGLMDYFFHTAIQHGAEVLTRCEVTGIEHRSTDFLITARQGSEESSISTEWVINAAGLESDTIASLAGIDVDQAGYRIHFSKGAYFGLPGSYSKMISRLVYPDPSTDSLGVHIVVDLAGRLRIGPDIEYLQSRTLDYHVAESKRTAFAQAARKILPLVRDDDLTPDISGIRPKLQAQGEPPRDFVIKHEKDRGLEGLINLIGIESPGLTASPAIAHYVRNLMS